MPGAVLDGPALVVEDNASVVGINLDRLLTVGGDLLLRHNDSFTTIFGDAYVLSEVGGDLVIEGNPSLEGFRSFEEHLDVCPECAGYVRSYRTTVALAKQVCRDDDRLPPEVPEDLVSAVLEARRAAG